MVEGLDFKGFRVLVRVLDLDPAISMQVPCRNTLYSPFLQEGQTRWQLRSG